jgi:LacI family transcriptional regulator
MLGEMSAELATPPLTTIHFPADELGNAAARMLVEMLVGGQEPGEQLLVKTQLNVRGSTSVRRR